MRTVRYSAHRMGVSAQGGVGLFVQGVSAQGVCLPKGCLPRRGCVFPRGVYTSPSPPEQNYWQTSVKT